MMRQANNILMLVCMAGFLLWPSASVLAHGDDEYHPKQFSDSIKAAAMSEAHQLYDAMMVSCTQDVLKVNLVEAARSGNKKALNMDRDEIAEIQECMKERGIEIDYENYYKPGQKNNPGEVSSTQAAELEDLQRKLDGAEPLAVPKAASATSNAPLPVPVSPEPVIEPAPVAQPAEPPAPEKGKPEAEPAKTKTRPAPRKYWVTP